MTWGFFVLLTYRLPGLSGVQYPPEFIDTGKSLLSLYSAFFHNPYKPMRDAFSTAVYTKNIGFQEPSSCRPHLQEVSRPQEGGDKGATFEPPYHEESHRFVTDWPKFEKKMSGEEKKALKDGKMGVMSNQDGFLKSDD